VASVCVAVSMLAGCHLFGSYAPTPDVDDAPNDSGTPEELDTRTEETAVPDTVEPGDTRNLDTTDVDTAEAVASDADASADTAEAVAGDADASVDQGLPANTCPDGRPSYRVRPAADEATYSVDGVCESGEYDHAIRLPSPQPGTVTSSGSNPTNNEMDCHLVWFPGNEPKIQGCCEVEDDEMFANTEPGDPREKVWGGESYDGDDRFEMWLKCNLDKQNRDCAYKFIINNREGTSEDGTEGGPPTHFESRAGGDQYDWLTDAWVVRNEGTGYVLEWTSEVPFATPKGSERACGFSLFDIDRNRDGKPEVVGDIRPFTGDRSINEPEYWGCCFFE